MATLFSDAFPDQVNAPGLVSYRSSGGPVKVATFSYVVPAGGVSVTTSSRINLFLLPFNARIVSGMVFVVTSFGTGFTASLVASDDSNTVLWNGGINLENVGPYSVDRPQRGTLYTAPSNPSRAVALNGGIRIALAPTASGNYAANGQVAGHFFYV
jgi:hypothetical protein